MVAPRSGAARGARRPAALLAPDLRRQRRALLSDARAAGPAGLRRRDPPPPDADRRSARAGYAIRGAGLAAAAPGGRRRGAASPRWRDGTIDAVATRSPAASIRSIASTRSISAAPGARVAAPLPSPASRRWGSSRCALARCSPPGPAPILEPRRRARWPPERRPISPYLDPDAARGALHLDRRGSPLYRSASMTARDPRARRRHHLRGPRVRRADRHRRRGRLQHLDVRLPGDPHRPSYVGQIVTMAYPAHRQRRHQRRGRGVAAARTRSGWWCASSPSRRTGDRRRRSTPTSALGRRRHSRASTPASWCGTCAPTARRWA